MRSIVTLRMGYIKNHATSIESITRGKSREIVLAVRQPWSDS
jgi:hypothetical protein